MGRDRCGNKRRVMVSKRMFFIIHIFSRHAEARSGSLAGIRYRPVPCTYVPEKVAPMSADPSPSGEEPYRKC